MDKRLDDEHASLQELEERRIELMVQLREREEQIALLESELRKLSATTRALRGIVKSRERLARGLEKLARRVVDRREEEKNQDSQGERSD